MPTIKILTPEETAQVLSVVFNHLYVVNKSSTVLELEFTHDDLVNPVLVIRDGKDAKAIEDVTKKYEGEEI